MIELKLDDSGRDVTWQALKYAAYCSQLKTSQIIEMCRAHRGLAELDQAREEIAEFLGQENPEDLALNPANSQRVILVAARFRPEVTATALWLLGRGMDVSCFQATAFEQDDRIFLSIDQVIPVPEAGDYMITVAEKAQEDEGQSRTEAERHRRRLAYWTRLLEVFDAKGVPFFRNRTPGRDNWITTPIGVKGGGVNQTLVITQSDVRAQINIERASPDDNAAGYAVLKENKTEIEARFGAPLEWSEKAGVKTRRLVAPLQIATTDPANIEEGIVWQADAIARLTDAVSPFLRKVEAAMNSTRA